MYQQSQSSNSRESEDERLARRLQEEEQRYSSAQSAMHKEIPQLTAQEREDMMLARQMAGIDTQSANSVRTDSYNSAYRHNNNGRGRNDRNYNGPRGYQEDYSRGRGDGDEVRNRPAAGAVEDRMAYARRLQEEAFEKVRGTSQPTYPKSTEEADRELAMRMQIEESDPCHRTPAHPEQEDEDMKLARFMEESGVSIRDLDEEGLAALKEQALGRGDGLRGPSLGLGGPPPPGGGGLGGGLLGGLYGAGHRDDDSDDSLELNFPPEPRRPPLSSGGPPEKIPSSIPPPSASSPVPSSIPPAPGRPPATMSGGHWVAPLATGGSRRLAGTSSPAASIPKSMPPTHASSIRADGLRRQFPSPPYSLGPGNSSPPGEYRRQVPHPSRSFGSTGTSGSDSSRKLPGHAKSAENLRTMQRGLRDERSNSPGRDRSVSPAPRGRKGNARSYLDMNKPLMDDLPPGVELSGANFPGEDLKAGDDTAACAPAKKEKKKGKLLKRIFGSGKGNESKQNIDFGKLASAIPAAIPSPPPAQTGPLPHSVTVNRNIAQDALRNSFTSQEKKAPAVCYVCGGRSGKMVAAMDKKFHTDCFRCMSCNEVIDPESVFAVSVDPMGEQQPLHRKCYAEFYGVQCAVCKKAIPANDDGSVSFIKHPFFNTEQMCPKHANDQKRRCTGCHRFEPDDEPFADLNDGDRCVCYACCRTVIMNNEDVKPLWLEVLKFFEFHLGLPIWEEMRQIPILVVDQAALNETQMNEGTSAHGDSTQIMTRGICLSEHEGSKSFKVPSLRFNDSTSCFEACNHSSGFMNLEVGPHRGNANSEVTAILCLSGLPRDLTASVLAHEATHAWIKLHPDFKVQNILPAQVEEGCAQLVAYLFLCDGLEPPRRDSGGSGPSDEKLRQYFKFSIETDDNEIYGEGYRRAATAYASIGIQGLLNHVVRCQEFPRYD